MRTVGSKGKRDNIRQNVNVISKNTKVKDTVGDAVSGVEGYTLAAGLASWVFVTHVCPSTCVAEHRSLGFLRNIHCRRSIASGDMWPHSLLDRSKSFL